MGAAVAANPVIKIAALCGSLLKGSFNRGLILSAIQLSKESVNGIQIEYIDISPLPILNTDLKVDGTFPPILEAFRQKILQADSILFASPEYNYSITENMWDIPTGNSISRITSKVSEAFKLNGRTTKNFTEENKMEKNKSGRGRERTELKQLIGGSIVLESGEGHNHCSQRCT